MTKTICPKCKRTFATWKRVRWHIRLREITWTHREASE